MSIAATDMEDHCPFEWKADPGGSIRLDLSTAIKAMVHDVEQDVSANLISARFHNTVAQGLLAMAKLARDRTGLETVAISGGVFCNRYLADRLIEWLTTASFQVLWNRDVPTNDGGISTGQAAIAASRRPCSGA